MTFVAIVEKFDSDLWYFYLPVPEEVAHTFLQSENKRVIATLDGKESYHCAIMSMEGRYFINVNKERRKKLGLRKGTAVQVELQPDASDYGMPVPEEFKEVLNQDPEGDEAFHRLTPGKQRSLLHIAGNVKNTDKRIERALVIVNHVKTHEKVDFKILNAEMKAFRSRS